MRPSDNPEAGSSAERRPQQSGEAKQGGRLDSPADFDNRACLADAWEAEPCLLVSDRTQIIDGLANRSDRPRDPAAMQVAHANGLSKASSSIKDALDNRTQPAARNGKPLLLIGKPQPLAAAANGHAPPVPSAAASKPSKPALITAPTAASAASAHSNGHARTDAFSAMPQAKAARRRTPPRQRDAANHIRREQQTQQPAAPARKPRVLAASTLAQQLNGSQESTPPSSVPRITIDIDLEEETLVLPAPAATAVAAALVPAPAAVAAAPAGQHRGNGLAHSKRKRNDSPVQEERKEAPTTRHVPAFISKKHRVSAAPPAPPDGMPTATAPISAPAAVAAVPAVASAAATHDAAHRASARTLLDGASWTAGWNSAVSIQHAAATSTAAAAASVAKRIPHARDSLSASNDVSVLASGKPLPPLSAPSAPAPKSPNFPVIYMDLSCEDDDHSSEVEDEDESAGDRHETHAGPIRSATAAADQANKIEWTNGRIVKAAGPAAASAPAAAAAASSSSAAAPATSPTIPFSQRSGSLWRQPHRRRQPAARPCAQKSAVPVDFDLTWSDSEDAVPGGHVARYKRGKPRAIDSDEDDENEEDDDDEVMELTVRWPAKAAAARAAGPIVSAPRFDSIDSLADHQSPEKHDVSAAAAASSSPVPPATVAAGARATSESDEIDSLADHISPADGGKSQPKRAAAVAAAAASASRLRTKPTRSSADAEVVSSRLQRALNRDAKSAEITSSPAAAAGQRQRDREKKKQQQAQRSRHEWSASDTESSPSTTVSGDYPPQDPRVGFRYQVEIPSKLTNQQQRLDNRFEDEERYVIPAAYRSFDFAASWAPSPMYAAIAARTYDVPWPECQDDADSEAADAFVAAADAAEEDEDADGEVELLDGEETFEVEMILAKRLDRSKRGKKSARFKRIAAAIAAAERGVRSSGSPGSSPSLPPWSSKDERYFCFLVKWANFPASANSWEPYECVRHALPMEVERKSIPFEHEFRVMRSSAGQIPELMKKKPAATSRRKNSSSSIPSEAESATSGASPKVTPAAAASRGRRGRRRNSSRDSTAERVPRLSAASLAAVSSHAVSMGIPSELDVLHGHAFLSSAMPLDSTPATSRSASDAEDEDTPAVFAALSREPPSNRARSALAGSASVSARIERKEDGGGHRRKSKNKSDLGREEPCDAQEDGVDAPAVVIAAPVDIVAAFDGDDECLVAYNNSPSQTGPEEAAWWVRGGGSHMRLVAAESREALDAPQAAQLELYDVGTRDN